MAVSCSREPLDKRNVFIGDSHIERWDLNYYFPGSVCFNAGVSGAMIKDANKEINNLNAKYDQCFIEIGTNDIRKYIANKVAKDVIADSVINDYTSLINMAQKHFSKIYVMSVIPLAIYGGGLNSVNVYDEVNSDLQAKVQTIAKTEFINLNPALVDQSGYLDGSLTQDGLHLNPYGYEKISGIVRNFVY